ncbi:hypothetical protein bcgnr5378_39280 [Bacillus cereus]|uniref:hypothetical protein n=2 Tax=Bacillus cereus group TaxID=86661 RepID=UPI003300D864|nr:hypothetical protein [Bacillus cereus]HDR4617184.1 hypothetical protein [Bacillus cereus]HDR4622741.1 hypothetical protein [Bacillus cereus]
MFVIALQNYLKTRLRYIILRKSDFFVRILKKFIAQEIINKYIYLFIIGVNLIKYFLYFIAMTFLLSVGSEYLSLKELVYCYFNVIVLLVLFEGAQYSKSLIAPAEEVLLSASPLTNREIYLFNWLSHFVIFSIPNYIFVLLGVISFFVVFDEVGFLFLFTTFFYFIIVILISFIVSVLLSRLSVNRVKNGYHLGTMLVSIITGSIALLISFVGIRTLLAWITTSSNLLDWKILIKELFVSLSKVINLEMNKLFLSYFFAEVSTSSSYDFHWIYLVEGLMIIVFSIWCWKISGSWYRTDWKLKDKRKKDWIDIIQIIFCNLSTNIILKVQILNLFRDRIQLSHHFTYFFYHYSNYIFIGAAVGVMDTVDSSSPIIRVFTIFVIFNSISRDAFEAGTTLFPGIVRFDGEGKSIVLYRITGTDLKQVYKQKLIFQRILGLFEFTLTFTIIMMILSVTGLELLFVLCLVLLNFLCIPHLKLLPSFASPHFNKQHYSEADDFEEQEIWEDSIESKLSQFLTIAIITPMIMMILFDFKLNDIYLVGSLIILLITGILYTIIRLVIKKITKKINKMDLV